jgi:hypothetical protein
LLEILHVPYAYITIRYICEEDSMPRIKLLVVVVLALILLMSTAAIAQTEQTPSGWYHYPKEDYPGEGGWWYYWAETGEWQQDPGTQPATSSGIVCDPGERIVVNGTQLC